MDSKSTSSLDTKSCYRLYAGHSNWINLNYKTTQDLIKIFQKGEPCRYQLSPGLFIDIIPNDVDCNSKNIDMVGLMRADLVYESQGSEYSVQQSMSHYVHSLLSEQGIIDAFPPLRKDEDLPLITDLPTHRHLSLVPSTVGSIKRGPKSISNSTNNSKNHSTSSSMGENQPSSSSTSPLSHGQTRSTSYHRQKKNFKRSNKHKSFNTTYNYSQKKMSLESPHVTTHNSAFANCSSTMIHLSGFNENHENYRQTNEDMLPIEFNSQEHNEDNSTTTMWAAPYSSLYPQSRSNEFQFELDIELDHLQEQKQQQQSPTDILNEYHQNQFIQQNHYNNEQLYTTESNFRSLIKSESIHPKQHFISNDNNSIENYVPNSPLQHWGDKRDRLDNLHKPKDLKKQNYFQDTMTTLPVTDRYIQDENHSNNILFSHVNQKEITTDNINSPL